MMKPSENHKRFLKMQNKQLFVILLVVEAAYVIGSALVMPYGHIQYPLYVIVIAMFVGFVLIVTTVLVQYLNKNEQSKQWLFSMVAFIIYLFSNAFYLQSLGTATSFAWFALFLALYTTQNKKILISFCCFAALYYLITMLVFGHIHLIVIDRVYYFSRFMSLVAIGFIAVISLRLFEHYNHMIVNQFQELDYKNTELKMLNVEVRDTKSILEDQYNKVYELAYYDQLTGLGNRIYYNDYLSQFESHGFGILIIDIINMKFINDTFSHQIGDRIIKGVSEIISDFFDEETVIARLGGDEFGVVLTDAVDLESIAEQMMMFFTQPIDAGDVEIVVNINMGLLDNFDGHMDKKEALKNADLAMVNAKSMKMRHSHYVKYTEAMSEKAYEQFYISVELAKAIQNQDIYVVFQPKYSSLNEKIVGFEALVRWEHQTMSYVSPDVFVRIAEQHGLIDALTDYVIRQSCQFAKKINAKGSGKPYLVTVNISGVQLMKEDFYQRMVGTLFSENTDANLIGIEITETAVMESLEDVLGNLNRLHANHIRISLDDFGTGYSSLNYLRSLPIDTLKIDKSFIDHVCTQEKDEYMVRMIIELAQYLDISIVAEGVEEEAQFQLLKALGCDVIQGYYFSKPLKFNDAVLLVKTE